MLLFGVSLFAMAGVGSLESYGSGNFYNPNNDWGGSSYADDTGHLVCDENGTALGEPGTLISQAYVQEGDLTGTVFIARDWQNETGTYPLTKEDVFVSGVGQMIGYDVAGSMGLIGLLGGVMLVATIAGARVFGFGESSFSVKTIVVSTFLIALFMLAALNSFHLLVFEIPALGPIFFFGLTVCYTVGSALVLGSSGGED